MVSIRGTTAALVALGLVVLGCGRTLPDAGVDAGPGRDLGPVDGADAGPADPGDGGTSSCDRPDLEITLERDRTGFDLSTLIPDPSRALVARVTLAPGVTFRSATPDRPALTTGSLADGSRVCLRIEGRIVGAGGAGGSGGTGAVGRLGQRPCGRDGEPGGVALDFSTEGRIDIGPSGRVAGGGGGGGGASGCELNAGGGGGAGISPGRGGAGASRLDPTAEEAFCGQFAGVTAGVPGENGASNRGGAGGSWQRGDEAVRGGRGGELGRRGGDGESCNGNPGGDGGAAGFAIVLGEGAIQISGEERIEGPVISR